MISITHAEPRESTQSDVQVVGVDLWTTEDNKKEQEVCTIEPPRRNCHNSQLEPQQTAKAVEGEHIRQPLKNF